MKKFNYLEFLSKECKTEIATADFVSQLIMNKVYEKGFKDACLSSEVIPISVLEDIKAEINEHKSHYMPSSGVEWGMKIACEIIDNHISRKEQQGENTDGTDSRVFGK